MHVDQGGEGLGSDETKMPAWIPCFICTRPRMAPKLWRESYSAKGMHALIDYHRSDILPSNVERLCSHLWYVDSLLDPITLTTFKSSYDIFLDYLTKLRLKLRTISHHN